MVEENQGGVAVGYRQGACTVQGGSQGTQLGVYVMFLGSSRAVDVRNNFQIRPRVERDVWGNVRRGVLLTSITTARRNSLCRKFILGPFDAINFLFDCALIEQSPTMHSVYARFNNISATLSTCLMVLLGAIACTSLLFSADPKGDITASVKVYVYFIGFFLRLSSIKKIDTSNIRRIMFSMKGELCSCNRFFRAVSPVSWYRYHGRTIQGG